MLHEGLLVSWHELKVWAVCHKVMKYVVYACNKRGQANYLGAANIQMEMYQLSAAGYLFVQAGFGSLFNSDCK